MPKIEEYIKTHWKCVVFCKECEFSDYVKAGDEAWYECLQ